jgi:DeoR family suf operon transcriptional repressor
MTAPASATSTPLDPSIPLGFRGLRGAILAQLKKAHRLTTRELATRLGSPLNTIRHHLKDLEQQGLVEYERQHRGVGAPSFAYRLTTAGVELFPRRYEGILADLLDTLVARQGRSAAVALLEARYAALAQRLQGELLNATPAERLQAVTGLLNDEGYMAESTLADSTSTLTQHNCAVQAVAERFPEICAAEAKFLGLVLGGDVRRERYILKGCSACEYHVRFNPETLTATTGQVPEPGTLGSAPQENT